MIYLTHTHHRRTISAIAETKDWIAAHPKSALVPEYEIHAAALLVLLAECTVGPDRSSSQELAECHLFGDRLKEIKAGMIALGKAA